MGNEFLRFSHKIEIESLIKRLIISISISLLAVGIPLLILKLLQINIPFWIYIIIGVVSFIISFLFSYLFKPSEIKKARRIDKEFNLNEKVLTMVEYQNKEGFMLDIQREDTNNRLKDIPTKNLKFKISYIYGILLLVSVGVSLTSFVLPVKAEELPDIPPVPDKDYDEDEYTIQRIKELIDEVKKSNCNKEYKIKASSNLTNLIPKIEKATLESEMKASVLECIDLNYLALIPSNSHILIYDNALKLASTANGKYFAETIKDLNIDKLTSFAGKIKDLLNVDLNKGIAELIEIREESKDLLERSVLKDSYGSDELYLAIINYGVAAGVGAINLKSGQEDLNATFKRLDEAVIELKNAMSMQICNNKMAEYLDAELKILFAIKDENELLPDTEPTNPDIEDPIDPTESEENGDNDGGMGDGEIIFGSDDLFFDPDLGYVKYGEIIDKYRALIESDIRDGILTPEMIEFYRDYFDKLSKAKVEER